MYRVSKLHYLELRNSFIYTFSSRCDNSIKNGKKKVIKELTNNVSIFLDIWAVQS